MPADPSSRMTAREAIALLTGGAGFTEHRPPPRTLPPDGPLGWAGYDAARERASARTGEEESVVYGTGVVGDRACVLLSFEFGFLGGSLGQLTGDRLEAAYELALSRRLPLLALVATGGSRMQEGMVALTQLQRVAAASTRLRAAGLPQIAVVRDPTTGGGWATVGAGADVVLALPGAQVGFAGSRVRPPDADPYAYGAEGQFAAGQVDAVVPAGELRGTVGRWLRALGPREAHEAPRSAAPLPRAQPSSPSGLPASGREAVERARAAQRPRAEAYLADYFTVRLPLHGDRCGGTDPGLLTGFGLRADGQPVAYVAQCGTPTRPAGYRAAARTIRLADRLGVPVLTLVDTPGAANDAEAERAGAGAAIADTFAAIAAARVPVTTLVIGEGGSGGALALAAPGNTHVTADSYFSVIAPEPAAAILKRAPSETGATADQLRLRPQDLVELGIARSIVT
ncbi:MULTISPECIES: carboxyl transferase domain-containing protein [Streptomyces]|uniref:carboxyl transferase domain-containing protein n=1 Tax=Streptomyces TaxID=1883 RepID=UPI000978F600|nr:MULTISPECIES: carboxyl transferase domain-containing protein [Streptomyces]NDZ63730.1 acetyl-CoA carboxylase [Streptomyces cyaneofuscatus]ONI53828.1 putative acetyl-coenzyme A carboxylase carboxyl transferase subunit beta [Streptomyces sp. IB2014 011-1]RDV52074.1 acetyl-CoA carboxylase [Streptomyces sp. IB2014 011-12]CAD5945046.1 Acetyl-coenzyme A carboxyl transferase alpha chain [Streptomyces sp. KY75]